MNTVLIISDDVEAASTRDTLFRQKNWPVVSETCAEDGLKTAQLLSPSLIVLDLDLPQTELVSLCRKLRALTSGTLLVLSSTRDEQKVYEFYAAGVDEHLTAPLPPIVLLMKCMAWLVKHEWTDRPAQPSQVYD